MDYDGLNECDKKRIKQIGFDRWLEEVVRNGQVPCGTPKTTTSAATGEHRAVTSAKGEGMPTLEELKKKFLDSKLTKSQKSAIAFIEVAEKNNWIVTFEQAAKIDPKYPTDPAYHAKQKGWQITTDRKNRLYKVGDYAPKH